MKAKARNLLLAFAALGLGASSWSSYVHYSLLTRPGYTSFCDMSDTISCTQAYLSEYGSLWGIPVALGGVFFFAIVLMLVAFARGTSSARENIPAYVFALSTVGLAFVLYLAWASFIQLNALCLLCTLTYISVIGIFIVSGGATSFAMSTLPRRASKDFAAMLKSPVALVLALIFSVGAVTLIRAFPRESHATAAASAEPQYTPLTDQQRFDFIRWYEVQPKVDVPLDAGGAKVLIVKFNDFQCPPCRQTYMEYKGLLEKYTATGRVKFVLKHYPLEAECNTGGPHGAACEAASAFVMAQSRGTADKLEEWFFANQPSLTSESVKEAAAGVAGIPDFDSRYAGTLQIVRTDVGLGNLLGVKSTPTFFINGRRIAGGLPPAAFEAAIDYELKK